MLGKTRAKSKNRILILNSNNVYYMLSVRISTSENPSPDGYYLVLLNVRDESYHRPTLDCHCWKDYPVEVYGGRDNEPGKEGGTWLAASKTGKVGVLLNILQKPDKNKKGRGYLVVDYVTGQKDAASYLEDVQKTGKDYNGFTLVTVEMKSSDGISTAFFNNISDESPQHIPPGIYSFGNSDVSKPWQKVIEGKKKFEEVIQSHPSTATKQSLIYDLIAAVSDRKQYPVQEAMRIQCDYFYPEDHLEKLSAMFVEIPNIGYGTRTHSVVLIDGTGQVDFYERTMKDPLTNRNWVDVHHTFQVE